MLSVYKIKNNNVLNLFILFGYAEISNKAALQSGKHFRQIFFASC